MTHLNSHQYGLALHTTSSQLGLSFSNFAGETSCQTWNLDRELSNYLHQHLVEFIQPKTWQDFAFIAVAKGPGSFTSTRIGVVAARTLAQQLNIPLFGISTLAALAWFNKDNYPISSLIPVQMTASRGQLYVAIYQITDDGRNLTFSLADTVMTPEAWQQTLSDLNIQVQPLVAPLELGITATSVLELAYQDWQKGKLTQWSEVIPFYGMSIV